MRKEAINKLEGMGIPLQLSKLQNEATKIMQNHFNPACERILTEPIDASPVLVLISLAWTS